MKTRLFFFAQGELPCLTVDGKVIMENEYKIATAPNGNGGLWIALKNFGILEDMENRGIEWLCSYCVDNILVKVGDPLLLGFGEELKSDIVAKVVPKAYPNEAVGVFSSSK